MPHSPPLPRLLGYWGKAAPADGSEARWHPLPYHCLDVACVTVAYLESNPSVSSALRSATGLSAEEIQRLCFLLACAHDLGKAHPGFQSKAEGVFSTLFPGALAVKESLHHSQGGLTLFAQWLATVPDLAQAFGDADGVADALEPLLNAACGHHGRPQTVADMKTPPATLQAVFEFMDEARTVLSGDLLEPLLKLDTGRARAASPLFAGVITLCDWVGSSQAHFSYQAPGVPLARYTQERLSQARHVVQSLGLAEKPAQAGRGFSELFPALSKTPSPLQRYADSVEVHGAGPQLFILEDETGAGKTEAALTLAARLVGQGAGRGVVYTLPTQTTANAIFGRIAPVAEAFFQEGAQPSLSLRHGASRAALARMLAADSRLGSVAADLHAWATDSSKTSLLADFGVCTIDQVVLSALRAKHYVLRQLGLANKVLVVDEAHACEPYLLELLAVALRIHAQHGGSAILLSATLPRAAKQKLLAAFSQGGGFVGAGADSRAYPLATSLSAQGLFETGIAARQAPRRVGVEPLHERDLLERVGAWLAEGKCVAVIRNTVRSAQETFDRFNGLFPGCCELVHARFVAAHREGNDDRLLARFGKQGNAAQRRGRLVVATQVVEQSLDVDFDELVTDLAPLDAVMQRLGRRRRHARGRGGELLVAGTPDGREPGPAYVLMPEAGENMNFLAELAPATSFVYPMPAVLWRTAQYFQEHRGLTVPDHVREAVDFAYSEDVPAPAFLATAQGEADGKAIGARQQARFVVLDPEMGYSEQMLASGLSSADCVTRLGAPSLKVVLCDDAGRALFGTREASTIAIREGLLSLETTAEGAPILRMTSVGSDRWRAAARDLRGKSKQVLYCVERGLQVL